jgi:bacillithiol biosynthesis cysteine-adding enzyme BshC
MPQKTIPYSETGYFSKLICDYLAEKEGLHSFYHRFPSLAHFEAQFQEKGAHFTAEQRQVLVQQLGLQYKNSALSKATKLHIELLSKQNTFTITTGHQLNLFTGPLYFLYKIFSVINLSEKLNATYKNQHFVPVYWMATEDHDFEEINYFTLFGKKIAWDRTAGGAVGELRTDGLGAVLKKLKTELGESEQARKLIALFTEGYINHDNLTDATGYIANALFADYGLVIVDGNNAALKKGFVPYVENELFEGLSHQNITQTTERLTALGYPEQVHPREINLFYLQKGIRERIIKQDDRYYVNDTEISFSKSEIVKELKQHPERFSPNALLRPLYQEVILPNLCYVGGGGELAYWFQLKDYFEAVQVPFPMLLLRNSALLISEKQRAALAKLDVSMESLFLDRNELVVQETHRRSEIQIDFSEQRLHLQQQFADLYTLAQRTDASFVGAVAAQEKKQLNGLDHLEKRLLKAQKRKLAGELSRLTSLQDELFPKGSLQERYSNFSEFYLAYGDGLLEKLKGNLDPLTDEFTVVTL